jgi:hypothetical protein
MAHAGQLNAYTEDHLAARHSTRIEELHSGQIIFLSVTDAFSSLHQPTEAESDFASGSSHTRTIFVLSDARKSVATSRQLSA